LGTAGQKKFFKVKYLLGALSYGAKIQSDTYIKNYIDLCMMQLLGAFSCVQAAFSYFTMVSAEFTLKIFPACYTLLALIEIKGTKLELVS